MQEFKVFLTYEAIYDIVDAEEYILLNFGLDRYEQFRSDIQNEIRSLCRDATKYASSGFRYRNYLIYKKPFSPSILFWVIKEDGVHVLRVPREESDWQGYFQTHTDHDYSYPQKDFLP